MSSVGKILSDYKLSSSDVLNYLNQNPFKKYTLNSKVDAMIEDNILRHFSRGKYAKSKKPKSNLEHLTIKVFTENIFNGIVQQISHKKFKTIDSYFTDIDAQLICSRMANRRIRYFSHLFFTNDPKIDHETLRYQIHYLANKALEFYGGEILTFICNLKQWNKIGSKVEVFKFEKGVVYDFETNFSRIRLQSFSDNRDYTIYFKRAYERPTGNYDAVRIKRGWTNESFTVSIKGELISDFENCIPEIALFQEMLNGQFNLYAGYDDGYCDKCGRMLSDAISIKYSRGPECRKNYGNPW